MREVRKFKVIARPMKGLLVFFRSCALCRYAWQWRRHVVLDSGSDLSLIQQALVVGLGEGGS